MAHGHLQRCKTSPGNPKHPHIAVRPRLVRQPGNHLLSIHLLLLGIFAFGWYSFTGAESANINAHANISPPREISMLRIILRRRSIIFSVRQIFEQGGELLASLRSIRHVKSSCQPHAILHRNPGLLHAHAIVGRRRGINAKGLGCEEEQGNNNKIKMRRSTTIIDQPDLPMYARWFRNREFATTTPSIHAPAAKCANQSPNAQPSYKDGCAPAPTPLPPR